MDRFELADGAANKFWEIGVSGKTTTVRFGKIGTDGQTQKKTHASPAAAKKERERLIAEKTKKGYRAAAGHVEILRPLLALYDELTNEVQHTSVWTGQVAFAKGTLAKWLAKKLTTRSETCGEFLERLAAAKARGERFYDLRVNGDTLVVSVWDWRDDGGLDDLLHRALEVAAPFAPKGNIATYERRENGDAGWVTRRFTGTKKVAVDEGEVRWDSAKVKAAIAKVKPDLDAWLDAHPATRTRIAHSGKYGYIDRTGREVIEATLTRAYEFSEGLAVVGDGRLTRLIDARGARLPIELAGAGSLMRALFPIAPVDTSRWGYADRTGALKIAATFAEAEPFYGPLAMVVPAPMSSSSRWLTPEGELVGDPFESSRYDPRCRFSDDRVWTWRAALQSFACFDEQGRAAITRRFANVLAYSEKLAAVVELGKTKWGYVDRAGEVVIPARFDEAHPFAEERAVVRIGKDYRLIDREGRFVSGAFSSHPLCMKVVSEGMLTIVEKSRRGFLSRDGDLVIKPRFSEAYGFFEGHAYVAVPAKHEGAGTSEVTWGHIDRSGEYTVAPTFEWTNRYFDGLASVKQAGLYGFIDLNGEAVVPTIYKASQPQFSDGLAWVLLP